MTKEELLQYRAMAMELKQLKQQLEKLRWQIENPKIASWSHTPGTSSSVDIMAECLAKLMDLEHIYTKKWNCLLGKRLTIETTINDLQDSEQRQLMRYRYIDGLTWEAVCQKMHISWDTVHRLHRKVLKNEV